MKLILISKPQQKWYNSITITDIKLYVPIGILWTPDNSQPLKKIKFGFERTINCNKYQWKISTKRPNQYLGYLIDPSFQGVNRLSVLSFENEV